MPEKALRTLPGARRFSYASLNEPRAFIALWLLSILATMTGAALLVRDARVARMLHETGSVGWIALATAPVVVYGALLALGVLAILLTRRVVWLVSQIGWLARRALPGSSKLPSNQDTSRLP
jgi:uncharacterized membrane protein YhaH (DUF805 family)